MSSATPRSWCERPPTYRFTTWRRSETEITRAFVSRLMRAAVRWRMPVSLVGRLGSGLRWKFARRICVRSRSTTMAPSILESSNRRFAVNEMLSGKPSLPAERTVSVSPTQMRAPRWPAMIMSRARRTAVPGAVMAMASSRRSSIVGSFGTGALWDLGVPSCARIGLGLHGAPSVCLGHAAAQRVSPRDSRLAFNQSIRAEAAAAGSRSQSGTQPTRWEAARTAGLGASRHKKGPAPLGDAGPSSVGHESLRAGDGMRAGPYASSVATEPEAAALPAASATC